MKFKITNNTTHFSFHFLDDSGNKIPVTEWENLQSEFLSQLTILNELFDNGFADFTHDSCVVENINILRLIEIDKQILDLPNLYPYEIYIESEGILTQNTFMFKYDFYDFAPNGNRLNTNRIGAILLVEEIPYLLTEHQYLLCFEIDQYNELSQSEKGGVFNLIKLSDLKTHTRNGGGILEAFLNNQELFVPEKIKLDIDFNGGALQISPSLELEINDSFKKSFDKFYNVRDSYPISGTNGETTRIIFSENQKTALKNIKSVSNITDDKLIQEIIEHPETFFDDDFIDSSVFYSERVKEIGIYSPKFYPFASPYKSQWIPGILIKDKIDGVKKIFFKTTEDLNRFIDCKEIAKKENKKTVEWENSEISIEDAEKFIEISQKQFCSPNDPIKQDSKSDQEVLIIKENAEYTEFSNESVLPENLQHNFYEILNLKEGISLKEHQKEGISWLQSLYKENFSGGLLADDMGLGKTLQLLYFIEWHCQNFNDNKPYLIVAPVSLLENWENEYEKFFSQKNLPLLKLYGGVSLTKENNISKNQKDAKQLQMKQIILTNYETLRSYQISLGLVDFAIVALDEAQKIKTPGTQITNASKALKSDFKIAMTGTPVENTLVDIWCLMDFAVPGLLGNAKDFAKVYQKPLIDKNTDVKSLTEQLRNNIGIFIKRRLKKDVAKDLPKKHDDEKSRIKRLMPSVQIDRYIQEIENANNEGLEGVAKSNQKLKSLWAIRDISDHPYLLDNQIFKFTSDELISSSSKLQTTIGILENIKAKNEKVIIFADRRETQKMLQKIVYDIYGLFTSVINGDTPTTKQLEGKSKMSRQQTIDRFQEEEGFNIIIMSPIAAGVGLNVTKANHIIHYTRHWNPAKEEQATDRAYRIGQEKDVYVYYPMAIFPDDVQDESGNKVKSFDEILDSLLNNKKALASNTLFPTEQAELTPDDLFGTLFGSKLEESKSKYLTIGDIDKLNVNLFKASIAALYLKQGFEVKLTPLLNNKGVDIIALKDGENYIIQAKQSESFLVNDNKQEISTAKNYYNNKYDLDFKFLIVINSDNNTFNNINEIHIVERNQLNDMINFNKITLQDINHIESKRLVTV